MPLSPAPVDHDPERIVENVHAVIRPDDQNHPDYDSRERMETHLQERMEPQAPFIQRVRNRWKAYDVVERTRYRFDRVWYMPPVRNFRQWVVGSAALLAALNIANGNVADFVDDLGEEIDQAFDNDNCKVKTIHTVEKSKETDTFYYSPNEVGESQPEVSIIDRVLDKLAVAQ